MCTLNFWSCCTFYFWISRSMNDLVEVTLEKKLIFPNDYFQFFIFFADELVHEKEKFKAISDELDQTFAEMSGY